jgi:hypothetical protein
MTRIEIEQELLNLPRKERAAVLHRVLATLSNEEQAALGEEFQALEATEKQARGERIEELMLSWFEGPSKEMTPADWEEIKKTRPEDVDPDSWAVPPDWTPPDRC